MKRTWLKAAWWCWLSWMCIASPIQAAIRSDEGRYILLDSAIFEAVKYQQKDRILTLVFQNGATYEYYHVPYSTYHQFMDAINKGAFFQAQIRKVYNYQRVQRGVEQALSQ